MKKIILYILFIFAGATIFSSCKEAEPLHRAPSAEDQTFVQFTETASHFDVNKLDADGNASDATYQIQVKILGPAPSAAATVGFSVVGGTATSSMYSFSAETFSVAAGQTYGTVDITLKNTALPLEEGVTVELELADGAISKAPYGAKATITLYKKDFCPYSKEDLIGEYDVVEIGYYADYTETFKITDGGDDKLIFTESFWYGAASQVWGETVIDMGDPVEVTFDDTDPFNPNIYLKEGYLQTTLDPNGSDEYPYYITNDPDNPWVLNYCDQTLAMYYLIPYAATDGGLVDIVACVLDYSGAKKTAYLSRETVSIDDPRLITKEQMRQLNK